MKPLKQILILLMLLVLVYSFVTPSVLSDDDEKWQRDMTKDYTKVLKEEKKQAERHRKLVGKWQEKEHLVDLIHLYENDPRDAAPYYYGLGYAYAVQGEKDGLDKARDAFQQAIVLEPEMFWAHFSLGGVHQQMEAYDLALQEMETCLRLNPKYYPAHYKIGEVHLKLNNHDQALAAFQAAQEINKKWKYPYYGIGLVHFAQGNDNQAWEAFEEAISRDKKFAPPRFKLGQVLAKKRFFEEALAQYEKASEYQPYTAEVLYELGAIFVEEGNAPGGMALLQNTVEIDPTYAPAHLQLGEAYYDTEQSDLAIEHYKQAIQANPTLKDYFIDELEQYHAGLMGAEEAKSLLDKSLAIIPDDPRAHFYYAQIEADMGNIDVAIQHYEKTIALIEADESSLEIELPVGRLLDAYIKLGDLYYPQGVSIKLGDLYSRRRLRKKAVAIYRRAIALDPKLEPYFFDLGKAAFDRGQFNQALQPLNKFLLIFPENVDVTYLLGRSIEELADVDNALKLYARTVELDPNHKDALFRSAKIYRSQNDPQNALRMLKKLIAIDPQNVEAHYLAALSHLELNHYDEALAAFLETARLAPEHVDAHYQAGLLYEQKGDIDNAVNQYERTIELDQSNADPFLRLGAIYLKRGDKENVIRTYEPALVIEPDHPQAQYDLAAIFEEREENEKAIKHFGLANQYNDTRYDWHFRYARLLDRHVATLEDYNQYAAMAVEEYTRTAALKSDYADAYFYRGLITRRYKQIGNTLYRYSQIAKDFKQAIQLQPRNADAHYYLGLTHVDLDQRRKAKEIFQKTLQVKSKYPGANLQVGLIAEWEQNYKEAIGHYEAEVAIDSKSAKSYQHLADLYNSSVMDFGRAKAAFQKALELEPNHVPTLLNYGNTLYNLDQLGAATEQFELALQLEPGDLTANYNLALMYEQTDKKQQAIDRWKRFLKLNPPGESKSYAEQRLQQLQP